MNTAPTVLHIDRLELAFAPRPWAFAAEKRAEIDAFFAELKRVTPGLWNGRVLLLYRQQFEAGVFRGAYLESDYASFAAWSRWGWPAAGVYDSFGAGAILGADGGYLLGVMSAHTLNAGQIYFPCGTPDPSDIAGDTVDLDFSVRRELAEETGLPVAEFETEPGWTTVIDGSLIAHIRVFRARETAEELRQRALAHLAAEARPELADIRIARGPADFDPKMRGFVRAFLGHRWRAR
jgi:8-oxo-dGTP pyrophosphatase MutT (NUDIX family)